ncbi:unnamed protein product [Lathyrus sativus]|nr:unnamed protein product [Lathyrus sativus]
MWHHLKTGRFISLKKSKIQPRVDGYFKVLEHINDTTYKIDLPGEYQVSVTFNVSDLTPCDVDDEYDEEMNLRTNYLKESGDVEDLLKIKVKDIQELEMEGPLTRENTRKLKLQLE